MNRYIRSFKQGKLRQGKFDAVIKAERCNKGRIQRTQRMRTVSESTKGKPQNDES